MGRNQGGGGRAAQAELGVGQIKAQNVGGAPGKPQVGTANQWNAATPEDRQYAVQVDQFAGAQIDAAHTAQGKMEALLSKTYNNRPNGPIPENAINTASVVQMEMAQQIRTVEQARDREVEHVLTQGTAGDYAKIHDEHMKQVGLLMGYIDTTDNRLRAWGG